MIRRAIQNITVAPRCRQVATGRLMAEKGEKSPVISVCRTRPYTDTEGSIHPCTHTSRNGHTATFRCDVTVRWRKKGAAADRALVLVANFSDEPLTIPKSTVLGVAESVSETWANLVNSDRQLKRYLRNLAEKRKQSPKLQTTAGHVVSLVPRRG